MLDLLEITYPQSLLIYGPSRSGKSTVCKQLVNELKKTYPGIKFMLMGEDADNSYSALGIQSFSEFNKNLISAFTTQSGLKCLILDDFQSMDLQKKDNFNYLKHLFATCRKPNVNCFIIVCTHYLGSCKIFRIMSRQYFLFQLDGDSRQLIRQLGYNKPIRPLRAFEFIHINQQSAPSILKLAT